MMNNRKTPFFNIPDFLYPIYDINKLSSIKKLKVLVYAKTVQMFFNNTHGKFFCLFMNILFSNYSKINFENGRYFKSLTSEISIFYPNKRISRVIHKKSKIFDSIFYEYCLDNLVFSDDDVIVDCGANVGELNYSLFFKGFKVNYYGIEPDEKVFECLTLNKISGKEKLFNFALSDKVGSKKFYLDTKGANSSLVYFGQNEHKIINTTTLDALDLPKKIKLFKLEAEGFEPEILLGSVKTLKNIEFVTVDFGSERGIKEEHTMVEVNELLIQNNFKLIAFNNNRMTGLYKNTNK
jgi:FkbM family methyltransferase